MLESTCAGCAGLPSARYPRNGLTCLVRVYLLCCCGACLRRSLRYHSCAFIHLERFDGLSCARKSSRRLRRFALGSTSKERPCSAWPGRLSPWTGFCISLLHAFAYCLMRIFVCLCDACCASCNLRPVPHPSLLRQLGRPGKGLTLTLRLVPHPRVPRHIWAGPTKEPEAGAPPLFATAIEGRPGKGLIHTLKPIPVQTHLGRLSNGFDNSRQPSANTLGKA